MSTPRPEHPDPWWRAPAIVAAVVTAIAGIIAALITVGGSGGGHGNATGPTPTTVAPTTPPSTVTTSEPSPTTEATTGSNPDPPVRRRGTLALTPGNHADLDSNDPSVRQTSGFGDVYIEHIALRSGTLSPNLIWLTNRKHADYQVCSDKASAIEINEIRADDIRIGVNICVLTDEERVAVLRVAQVQKDKRGGLEFILFNVTVWETESP